MGPNFVLLHLALIAASWAATGCADVALPPPLFSIVSCLKPVVRLPDLIHGLVDTQMT
jgi:hypothetical protein